jgi:hypothetical protein
MEPASLPPILLLPQRPINALKDAFNAVTVDQVVLLAFVL